MRKMDVKGQASAEYLLLMLVFLIILGGVTLPLVGNSIKDSMDVSHTSDASAAVNSIANAIGLVYSNGPGAVRTINVYIPVNGTLSTSNSVLLLPVTLTNSTIKNVNASIPYNIVINSGNVIEKKNYNVTISWPSGTSPIQVNLTQT